MNINTQFEDKNEKGIDTLGFGNYLADGVPALMKAV